MKIANVFGILLAAAISTSAFADGGEGRNGPDQVGISIPVSADNFVTVRDFEQLQNECILKQRQDLLSQILGATIDRFNASTDSVVVNLPFAESENGYLAKVALTSVSSFSKPEELTLWSGIRLFLNANTSYSDSSLRIVEVNSHAMSRIRFNEIRSRFANQQFLEEGRGYLQILFGESYLSEKANTFDFLGIAVSGPVVKSYSLKAPSVKFVNIVSRSSSSKGNNVVPTNVKLNDQQYAQCISDGLGK